MSSETRISLRVANKRAFVWDVDDIAILRAKHHICGTLVGTLPHLSQQNAFLGVPLVLMPEEVVLLVENEIAVLVDDAHAHHEPTAAQLSEWNRKDKEDIRKQLAAADAKDSVSTFSSNALSPEAIQKRKAREEKRQAAAAVAAAADAAETSDTPRGPDSLITLLQPNNISSPSRTNLEHLSTPTPPITTPQNTSYTITIPAGSSDVAWYQPQDHTYTTIADAKQAGIWDYPNNLHERATCGVYRSLWEKGYFMGGGMKFGGEYLVYPGDPLRYHSHFVASILDSPTAPLRPMEIVAHGRLGTGTKKAHLLCRWDDISRTVSLLSIEWAGFG